MSGEVSTRLASLESVIARGLATFVEVGAALMEIRDARLYRQTHPTFEAYVKARWGWERQTAYRYIESAEVANVVTSLQLPSVEHAHMLAPLPPAEQQALAPQISDLTVREAREVVAQHRSETASTVHFSSETPEWYTPPEIVARVVQLFGTIDLDPCCNPGKPVIPAKEYYRERDRGHEKTWGGKVYMNPPYGRAIAVWVEKLIEEYEHGHVSEFVALVPARTDTEWFQQFGGCLICFVDGRLHFSGHETGAPFPSAVVYGGERGKEFCEAFSGIGPVWKRVAG